MRTRLACLLELLRGFWRDHRGGPKSLVALAREPRRRSPLPTSRLYVIEVDFAVDPVTYESMQTHLNDLREKFGLEFFMMEPGFKLKRFDDY